VLHAPISVARNVTCNTIGPDNTISAAASATVSATAVALTGNHYVSCYYHQICTVEGKDQFEGPEKGLN